MTDQEPLKIPKLFAMTAKERQRYLDSPQAGVTLKRLIADIDDPNGVLCAFQSFTSE